jgi:hypothetical protein
LAAAALLMVLPADAIASDWRIHLNICNQEPACAKEQAAARDLWESRNWTPALKESCRKKYIEPYAKDYSNALKCVTELEKQRQEMEKNEAYIDRKRKEQKTYRSWGGIIIK